ncbi:MAG: proline--tRNA ligase [Anaerolineales bacterium]|nr:proline--tRNA ligase [Anaerolineales bacterium]
MAEDRLPSRAEDFSEWYNQLVLRAELADYAPVRGCMVVRPYGWALWENITRELDRRFKATGHVNAGFPMFIPKSFLEKEKEHVEGFSPELAVVTIGGGEKLEEPLAIRPTSETIIGHMYAKWVKSYRDLPILINLWNSVVRWEKRTKLFLRTTEFYWQEGHTAHATAEEAEAETRQMLDIYADFAENEAAVPVIRGRKSESEKFAGASATYAVEAMMGDGKALQSATSHNLGQNFAKAFNIQYLDPQNALQYAWTTSWGLSTRFVGAIIMVHGDDTGLILPPRLAPIQAVITPIWKKEEEKAAVCEQARRLEAELKAGLRVTVDLREGLTPGFKFNDWEMRGVPVRIELGPRDLAGQSVMLARRDKPGREGKTAAPWAGLAESVETLLGDIQQSLFQRAKQFRDSRIQDPPDYASFREAVENGFASSWWCGAAACEEKVKKDTKATIRCIPFDQPGGSGNCIVCGKSSAHKAVFGKAY